MSPAHGGASMSDEPIRPLPFDPSKAEVAAFIDRASDPAEWLYLGAGDYQTACVEAMKRDGTDLQRLIALELTVRSHGETEPHLLRVLMAPEDAAGIAQAIAHSARWLDAARRIGN